MKHYNYLLSVILIWQVREQAILAQLVSSQHFQCGTFNTQVSDLKSFFYFFLFRIALSNFKYPFNLGQLERGAK